MGELLVTFGEDGKAHMYDSDFDVTIHCEDEQQMNEAVELLHLANRMRWRKTVEDPPTEKDSAHGNVLVKYMDATFAQSATWDTVASAPDLFTLWMPMPKLPGDDNASVLTARSGRAALKRVGFNEEGAEHDQPDM